MNEKPASDKDVKDLQKKYKDIAAEIDTLNKNHEKLEAMFKEKTEALEKAIKEKTEALEKTTVSKGMKIYVMRRKDVSASGLFVAIIIANDTQNAEMMLKSFDSKDTKLVFTMPNRNFYLEEIGAANERQMQCVLAMQFATK